MFDRKTTTARRLLVARVASRAVALGLGAVAIQVTVFRGRGLLVTFGMIGLFLAALCVQVVARLLNRRGDPRHKRLPRDFFEQDDPHRIERSIAAYARRACGDE